MTREAKLQERQAHKRNRIRMTRADVVYQVVIYTIVTLFTICCVIPLLYVIGLSLTSEGEMIQKNYFVIIPEQPTLKAYEYVFNQFNFWNSMGISVARTILGVAAMLVFVIPGGYIMAKREMPGQRGIMIFFIITMLIGGGLIPGYLLMRDLKLLNTFWVYIVPAFGNTYNMLIVKLFVENIPKDIIESADLDGASEIQKMLKIAVPLLVPTLCALSLFAAVAHWNSWFDALLYVRDSALHPVQFIIRSLMLSSPSDTQNLSLTAFEKMTPEGVKMACVIVGMVPILCVYPFLQKYFIFGMYTGSVKG